MRHDPIDPAGTFAGQRAPASSGRRAEDGRDPTAALRRPPAPRTLTFLDRADAGRKLADALVPLISPPFVVGAIPRGGVAVALPIVERTGAPLTAVHARRLTSALAPEFAFGALDEDDEAIVNEQAVSVLGLSRDDIESTAALVAMDLHGRIALYEAPSLTRFLPGAAVVIVDDGLATGLTMRAAIRYARRHGAREIVVAVPCASPDAAARCRQEADCLVALVVDPEFCAVGAYYTDFSPVDDDEVMLMLDRARACSGGERALHEARR